jgi:CRP-like cAMP-binding protein
MQNGILRVLSEQDLALLMPRFEQVTLKQGEVLHERFQLIEYAYFLERGLSSEIAINSGPNRIEVGCVGREGMSGVPVLLGVESTPHQSFMQAGGSALRIASSDLHQAMQASPSLNRVLLRYVHVFMIQIAATALADGRYAIDRRLARWLLMCHDRLGDELTLTHDFLALMLGVRRPSVTEALHILEGHRVIKAERGLIIVRDRKKLEVIAGDAYGIPEAEYSRMITECPSPARREW